MNNEHDIDFQLITDEEVVNYLLSSLYTDINTLLLRWSDRVPQNILELTKQLHKELQQC